MMNIDYICMSIFTKENCIEYNTENTIKLLELFKEKEVIPSFIVEPLSNMKLINRPLIKSNTDNIILVIKTSRIDIYNDNTDKNVNWQYRKEELLNFFDKFEFYLKKLKSAFEDLSINRIAINSSILCDRNDIKLPFEKNFIKFNIDKNIVEYTLRQREVVKLYNLKKEVNAISTLLVSEKLNIKFDINTLHNLDNKFEDTEIENFFKDSIELISNFVTKLKE